MFKSTIVGLEKKIVDMLKEENSNIKKEMTNIKCLILKRQSKLKVAHE